MGLSTSSLCLSRGLHLQAQACYTPPSPGVCRVEKGVFVPIDLHQIGETPLAFSEDLSLGVELLDPDIVAGTMEMHLEGQIMALGDHYLIRGAFRVSGPVLCTRCLQPVPWEDGGEFNVEIRPPLKGGEDEVELDSDELDVLFLEGNLLELRDLAVEQISLGLPMRVLCRPECAGLCPRCGANKNIDGACRCEPEIDPRWEALRGLGSS